MWPIDRADDGSSGRANNVAVGLTHCRPRDEKLICLLIICIKQLNERQPAAAHTFRRRPFIDIQIINKINSSHH